MKFHLVEDTRKHGLYTYRTLYAIAEHYKVPMVDAESADVILVSVDDPDDLNMVKRAKKLAAGRPLIAGGFEGFGGEYLLAYCDGVNAGEGFDFFELAATIQGSDPAPLFDAPYVLTRSKNTVLPSYRIDANLLPLVKIGPKAYYYLAGKGCRGRCTFCETGFVYPGWSNDTDRVVKAYSIAEKQHAHITFITNDSSQVAQARTAQSVRVKDYLADPGRYKGSMLHFGIEGFTEEQRRRFYKFISDDDIRELVKVLGRRRQLAEFFFITGFPGTYDAMLQFAESMPLGTDAYPKIYIKLTRFDPCPHTPLWAYDTRKVETLTAEQIRAFHYTIAAHNRRFRMYSYRSDVRSLWRPLLRRCTWDEVSALGPAPESKYDFDLYVSEVEKKGLSHLLTYDGRLMPSSQIVCPNAQARDRIASVLGMMPVNYKSRVGQHG